MSVTIS